MLKIVCIINGYLEENCYIIHNNKNALIVDPGSELDKIESVINKLKLNVVGILITHYHFDHVLVLDEVKELYKTAVLVDYKSEDNINIDEFHFKKIDNYGHTRDSVSYYFESDKIMFTGDFVFKDSIGKYDLENESVMFDSLKRFKLFDDDIKVYPGHGESTTVGCEKKYNYFLRGL